MSNLTLVPGTAPATPASGKAAFFIATDLTPTLIDDTGAKHPLGKFPRISTTVTSTAIAPDINTVDLVEVTALASTLTLQNPTGTPVLGQKLLFKILDAGTGQTLSFGTSYRALVAALPTTTTANKLLYLGFIYNSQSSTWDFIAKVEQP